MIKTMDELKNATDEELIECYIEAQGHTKDFQSEFGTNYSYSMISNFIKGRGYVMGWHKPSEETNVNIEASEIECSLSHSKSKVVLNISDSVAKEWSKFTEGSTQKWIFASAALKHFIKEYKKGKVSLKITM